MSGREKDGGIVVVVVIIDSVQAKSRASPKQVGR
jgi:hypothetical protein